MTDKTKKNIFALFIHLIGWLVFLMTPLIMLRKLTQTGANINYWDFFLLPFCFILVFYIDYLLLIPKLLFKGKTWLFSLFNVVLVVTSMFFIYNLHQFRNKTHEKEEFNKELIINQEKQRPPLPQRPEDFPHKPRMGVAPWIHDSGTLLLVIIFSILIRFTLKWFETKEKVQQLEKTKIESELKNLKNQLNPHFLFNTLNNIYALIGISQDKAQQAVLDLSKLLRYVLYDSTDSKVPLSKEVEFIENYIKLMQLRLQNSVSVTINIDINKNPDQEIVQLLFISLVENAFKHGVSPNKKSFININIEQGNEGLLFTAQNSYFPKEKSSDKSGSGIGLENLRRTLELSYPGKYEYTTSIEDNCYTAKLLIKE